MKFVLCNKLRRAMLTMFWKEFWNYGFWNKKSSMNQWYRKERQSQSSWDWTFKSFSDLLCMIRIGWFLKIWIQKEMVTHYCTKNIRISTNRHSISLSGEKLEIKRIMWEKDVRGGIWNICEIQIQLLSCPSSSEHPMDSIIYTTISWWIESKYKSIQLSFCRMYTNFRKISR